MAHKFRKKGRKHGHHPHTAFRGRQAGGVSLQTVLSQSITLNNTTVSPEFVYYGRDASPDDWPAAVGGEDLANVNRGADTTIVAGLPGYPADNAAQGNGYTADYFRGSGNSVGDVELEDYVFEFIFYEDSTGTGASRYLFSKQTESGSFDGYATYIDSANHRLVHVQNSPTVSRVLNGLPHPTDQYNHCMIFSDRSAGAGSNGYRIDINGSGFSPGGAPPTDTLTSARPLSLNAFGGSSNGLDGDRLAYIAMWKLTDWFSGTNTTEWDAFALARYNLVSGINS